MTVLGRLNGLHDARTDPVQVLEEVKRLAVEQLGSIPGALYAHLDAYVNDVVRRKDEDPRVLRNEQGMLRLLQLHAATRLMRFRERLARGFEEFRSLASATLGSAPLGLVGDNQIEFYLDGQRLSENLGQRYSRPLKMLDSRFEAVAMAIGIPAGANPIGPGRLVDAFIDCFGDAELTDGLRSELFKHFELELYRVLGDLYARANAVLASAGYGAFEPLARPPERAPAPVPAFGQGPAAGTAGPPPGAAAAPGAPGPGAAQAGAPAASDGGEARAQANGEGATATPIGGRPLSLSPALQELRQLLHQWRQGVVRGDAVRPEHAPKRRVGRRELKVEEVVSVLSLLQPEPPDSFARALAGSGRLNNAIREHLVDGARRLGIDPDQATLSEQEEDAVDLVSLLFEQLFRSHALLDRARRLYARLVLPYVKVALLDEGMFVSREHPARKLLDAITEACEGNTAATPQERELLDRASHAAQKVASEFRQDIAIFEAAHAELEALLRQQRRRVQLQEERAAQAIFGRERLNRARDQADEIVRARLAAQPLTDAVAQFLIGPWRHYLVQVLVRESSADRQAEALRLGDGLAMADEFASQLNPRVADQLIGLLPLMKRCLESSGVDETGAQHELARLVHALAFPDTPRQTHALPPREDAGDDEGDERRLWLAGGKDTVPHDPALAERMRRLQPGDWVRLRNAQGDLVAAKVAWLSPLTGRLLLVDRRGARVMIASAEELAVLAAEDRLVLAADSRPFDEAMQRVREALRNHDT